ncbi:hypothetical protein Tco_0271662 [Tanacetum coccineum]
MRAREKRNKPRTQAQQRKLYCNYLKNMEGYTLKQLKSFKFEVIKEMFNKAFKRVNTFVDNKTELVEGSEKRVEDSTKEDLETLWKLVKAKHGSTRLEESYERVLWGYLMIMLEPDVESPVWRTLQNEKVLIWKLFDSCGVHFMRLQSMHIFMLVEKRYPLTPVTITCTLNKKLQADHWNKMCYQLLKLITKQLKNPGSGRIVGIKSFIRLFGITAALIKVSAAQEESLALYKLSKIYSIGINNDPDDIAKIFKIKGNLFDFETPWCKAFNEFKYLFKINTDLFAFDIPKVKTCEEYELNNNMTEDLEEPWSDNGDHKWYKELDDGKLKVQALMHKAIVEGSWGDATPGVMKSCAWLKSSFENFHELDHDILVKLEECWNYGANNAGNTQDNQEHKKEHHDPSTCHVRRFEMIKYSFDAGDEYVAIKEHECSDHSKTNIDACQAYREIFCIMDKGWLVMKDVKNE